MRTSQASLVLRPHHSHLAGLRFRDRRSQSRELGCLLTEPWGMWVGSQPRRAPN